MGTLVDYYRRTRSHAPQVLAVAIVLATSAPATDAHAQMLRAPTFQIEPGAITINAVSSPLETGSSTGLNLRFVAIFPTMFPWLSLEVATTFAPLGLSNGLNAFNEPTFYYGPVTMLLPRDRTANWLELTLPVLGAYHLDDTGDAERLYVHDLVAQGAAVVPVGERLLADMGSFWSRLTLYVIAEQNLTPGRNPNTRRVDRFNPAFQYGVSIPLGRRPSPQTPPGGEPATPR